jgi:hypothetical protein
MASNCIGFEGRNAIVFQENGEYVHTRMGNWIDQLLVDHSDDVKLVDGDASGAIQQLELKDESLKIWCTDQVGLPQEKQITGVRRTDLSKLPSGSYQLLRFLTQNGTTMLVGSDTPLVTRVNNELGHIPAEQWTTDPRFMIACNLWSYILRTSGPELVQFALHSFMPVPEVITGTWGVVNITRGDAAMLLEICDMYPESVAPGDREVFDAVLMEMIQYDPIVEIRNETEPTNEQYLYWIETEWGSFASFMNSFFAGVPHISPLFKPPLNADQLSEAKKNTKHDDIQKVISSYKSHKKQQ